MPSFPDTPLELTAEAAFGADLTAAPETWLWTALTCPHPAIPSLTVSRVLDDAAIGIKRGIAVGGTQQQTSSASVTLLNLDGALTPELVTSPHWPYVDAGTPFRLRMRTNTNVLFSDTFTRTVSAGGWGTSDSGHTYTCFTGTNFSTTGAAGQITVPTAGSVQMAVSSFAARDVDVRFDASSPVTAAGGVLAAGAQLRLADANNFLWATVEFRTDGSVGYKLWSVAGGVYTSILSIPAGVSYAPGIAVRCRVQAPGDRMRAKVWLASDPEPDAWLSDVRQTDFPAGGDFGIECWAQPGNTDTPVTLSVDNLSVRQAPLDRIEGYIADIRPSFIPQPDGTTWSTVVIDIAGVGSRLEKRQSATMSPLRRSVQLAELTPIAYWPMEDDQGSLQAASAFPGGLAMNVAGPAVFGFTTDDAPSEQYLTKYGTKPLVSLAAGARMSAVVPMSAVTDQWAITVVTEFFTPDVPGISEMRVMQWDTPSGTYNRWALVSLSSYGYQVRAYQDATGTVVNVATYNTDAFIGLWTATIEASQVGADILVQLFANDNLIVSGTATSATQAPITRVMVNPDRTNTTASVTPFGLRFIAGHVRIVDDVSVHDTPYYSVPETGDVVTAIKSWYLEPAHRRLERLCTEERVPFDFVGDPSTSGMTILNAQQPGTFTDLMTQAADSESGGLLFEHRYGYRYLPRSARYNQPPALVVDMAAYAHSEDTDPSAVLVPQLDTRAANYWTISRSGGSSATYAADEAYRTRRGTINEARTLDVLTDDVLLDHASWRTHLSVDGVGANYPSVLLDLAANPGLIVSWLGCDIGSRVQRTNQPIVAGIGVIDQVIEGWTETISPWSWSVEIAGTPGSVWDVGVWDNPAFVYSPSMTTLSVAMSTTTGLSLTMTGEPWITGAVDLLLEVDGEHVHATNITGSGNGPYTVTLDARSVNGRVATHIIGAKVNLANPTRWAL